MGDRTSKTGRRAGHGWTLIELVIVLAVLSTLLGYAAPSLVSAFSSTRLNHGASAMLGSLHLARSEAIRRNSRVTLCVSADGEHCEAAGGWEQGWLLFDDLNGNGRREPQEEAIQHMQALDRGMRMSGNTHVQRYISYLPAGSAHLVSGAFQAGTLSLCVASVEPAEARQIVINSIGRPRVARATLASCL